MPWKFHSSYRHSFVYRRGDDYLEIRGDLYMEFFPSEMGEEALNYYRRHEDVELTELVYEHGALRTKTI